MPNITTNHAITCTNCQVRDKSHTVRTWQTSNHTGTAETRRRLLALKLLTKLGVLLSRLIQEDQGKLCSQGSSHEKSAL